MMKRFFKPLLFIGAILGVAVLASSCGEISRTTPETKKDTQAQAARNAANTVKFNGNAEIDNIKRRLELTSRPALRGYVILLSMGRPVAYIAIKGKITSGSKRLTRTYKIIRCDKGEWTGDCVVKAASDEGTYGRSNPYIYFWTVNDAYIQWNGAYLYSDKPFPLEGFKAPIRIGVKQPTDLKPEPKK